MTKRSTQAKEASIREWVMAFAVRGTDPRAAIKELLTNAVKDSASEEDVELLKEAQAYLTTHPEIVARTPFKMRPFEVEVEAEM